MGDAATTGWGGENGDADIHLRGVLGERREQSGAECPGSIGDQGLGVSIAAGSVVSANEFSVEPLHGDIPDKRAGYHGSGRYGKDRSTPADEAEVAGGG